MPFESVNWTISEVNYEQWWDAADWLTWRRSSRMWTQIESTLSKVAIFDQLRWIRSEFANLLSILIWNSIWVLNLLKVATTIGGTEPSGPPEGRSAEWNMDLVAPVVVFAGDYDE